MPTTKAAAAEFDALIIPGGFGAAKNLSSFAADGDRCTVDAGVAKLVQVGIRDFCEEEHQQIEGSRGRILTHFDAQWQTEKQAGTPYAELVEREYMVPAPYMARIFWIAAENWTAHRNTEWEEELRAAHEITYNKLPPRTKAVLAMPTGERTKLIAERRKILAEKCATPGSGKKKAATP